MSDTNAFDTFEKVEFLFKNYLGYANTQNNKPFFQETEIQTNNYIYGSNVFLDVLPTHDRLNWNTLTPQDTSKEINADNFTSNTTKIQVDAISNPIVKKYIKVKLTPVPLSGNQSYYALDKNGKNILQDAIQSNVNKDGSVQPYLYTLFKNDAVTPIPNTELGGNWVFDIKNGVINFVDIQNISDANETYHISESEPPYLTFVKYVGRKGTQNITDDFDKYDVNFDASGSVLYVTNDGKVKNKFPFVNYKSERPNTGISGELFLNTDNQGYLEYYTDENKWKRIGVEVHHGLQKNDLGAISVTSDISLNDVSLNTLSYYTDSSYNINVKANLVPPLNQLFNLGSSNSKWDNVYTNNLLANFIEVNDISASTLTVTDISAVDISAVDISASTLTVTDISAVDISAVDISASTLTVTDISAVDISALDISASTLTVTDISAVDISASTLTVTDISAVDISASNLSISNLNAEDINTITINTTTITTSTLTVTDISAVDISVVDISASTLTVTDISAVDISAVDISASTLTVTDISAVDISASTLTVTDISAVDISGSNLSISNLNAEDINTITINTTTITTSTIFTTDISAVDISASTLTVTDISAVDISGSTLIVTDISAVDISAVDISASTLTVTDISAVDISAVDISASNLSISNLNAEDINTSTINTNTITSSTIITTDISAVDISAVDISAVDISASTLTITDISAVDISANNISTSNLNTEDILSVTFKGNNLGTNSDPFEKLFITDLSASNLGTINDISNNLYLKSNLIPSGIKDASNIIQISLGDDQNIFNNAVINDISLNRIGYLSDTSKNIMVNGHLIPSGPYDICNNIIEGQSVEFNLSKFSLGSFNNRWRSLYVSDKTIWIGQSSISTKSTTTTDEQGREKTTIELLFIPEAIDKDDDEDGDNGSDNNTTTQPAAIAIAKGEFLKTVETEIDPVTQEVVEIETFVPIEDSFAIGNLLELADVDISKNELQDGNTIVFDSSNEKFIIGPNLYVNNKFQTFEEILTQQPLNFTLDSSNNGTGKITLSWNYDDILAMDAYGPRQNALETLPKRKMIPFIDKIHVDISGVIDPNNPSNNDNIWLNYNLGLFDNNGDYAIGDNDNYDDGDTYKKLEIRKQTVTNTDVQKILSRSGSNNSFSFRIYGINNAHDDNDIIDERSLYVYNTFFTTAETPLAPYYISASQIPNTSSNDNKLSVIYKVRETEKNNPTSLAGIIEIASSYKEFERSVSAHSLAVQVDVNTVSTQETHSYSSNPIEANENITWEQTGLKPGTSYQFQAKVKNNLNDQFGDLSSFEPTTPSISTDIPITTTSNKKVTFLSPASSSLTNIFSPNFTNNSGLDKYYINLSAFSDNDAIIFTPTISDSGVFEITTDTVYGARIDGSKNLITLNVYKDYDSQNASATQTYQFNGYNTTSNPPTFNNVVNYSSDPKYLQIATFDQYYANTTNANVGFRLNGRITINGIEKQNCNTLIGGAQHNPHILRYELTRSTEVQSTGNMLSSRDYELYIDELSGAPSITSNTSNVEVKSVKYTMGIASVNTMTINIKRTYKNCNSINKFIVGNRIVGSVGAISNTNFSKENKLLTSTDINSAATVGEYTHNIEKADTVYNTTNGFNNGRNNSLSVSTSAFNLNSTTNGGSVSLQSPTSNQTTLNHFYDRLSYANNTSSTSKFVLTTTINSNIEYKISQIDTSTINNLGNDIGSITTTDYTNHITAVNDCTLLYIGGKFQSNLTFTYPDTSQINYDIVSVTEYTHGATSYALDGRKGGSGTKYKWICLNAFQNGSDKYNILGTDISIESSDGVNYIDLNTVLSNYFGTTVRNAIFSSSEDGAVCFVTSTKINTTNKVMATPQGGHPKSSPWYNEGTGTISWNNIISTSATYNKYKCKVSSYGISVDNTALKDDLQIFIGVKNE